MYFYCNIIIILSIGDFVALTHAMQYFSIVFIVQSLLYGCNTDKKKGINNGPNKITRNQFTSHNIEYMYIVSHCQHH